MKTSPQQPHSPESRMLEFFFVENDQFNSESLRQEPHFNSLTPVVLAACCNFLHFHYPLTPLLTGSEMKILQRKLNELAPEAGLHEAERQQVGLKFAWHVGSKSPQEMLGYFGDKRPQVAIEVRRTSIRLTMSDLLNRADAYFVTAAKLKLQGFLKTHPAFGFRMKNLRVDLLQSPIPLSVYWPYRKLRARQTPSAEKQQNSSHAIHYADEAENSVRMIPTGQFESNRRRH